jgi:hypothetical protein
MHGISEFARCVIGVGIGGTFAFAFCALLFMIKQTIESRPPACLEAKARAEESIRHDTN